MKAWPPMTTLAVRFVFTPRMGRSLALSRPCRIQPGCSRTARCCATRQEAAPPRRGRMPVSDRLPDDDLTRVAVNRQPDCEECDCHDRDDVRAIALELLGW